MTEPHYAPESALPLSDLAPHLTYLKLAFIAEQYAVLATQAAHQEWSHVDYLARLLEGEVHLRKDRATKNRIHLARFPIIKTLDQFRWDWPTQINRLPVQNHFRLEFIKAKANLILLGGVGLGKPQPGNYPSRSQRITRANHHRHGSPSSPVWSNVHAGRHDAPCATGPVLRGVAAAL